MISCFLLVLKSNGFPAAVAAWGYQTDANYTIFAIKCCNRDKNILRSVVMQLKTKAKHQEYFGLQLWDSSCIQCKIRILI